MLNYVLLNIIVAKAELKYNEAQRYQINRSTSGARIGLMPVKIFCCYAHEDEVFFNQLKRHLSPLRRQGFIDIWYDRDISAGTEWEQTIKEELNTAQIILL